MDSKAEIVSDTSFLHAAYSQNPGQWPNGKCQYIGRCNEPPHLITGER